MITLWQGIREFSKGPQVLPGLLKLYSRIQSSLKTVPPLKLGRFLHEEDFIGYPYDSKSSTLQQKTLLQLNNQLTRSFHSGYILILDSFSLTPDHSQPTKLLSSDDMMLKSHLKGQPIKLNNTI